MNKNWSYGILDDAVNKASSNISLNKIQDEDGDYPVFGAKGFMKNVSFYQQEKDYLALIKDGAGIGRVSKHPAKSSILATMQYIIPKEDYDIDFIKYFLKGLDFEDYRTGSTIPHIYFKDYKNARFPLVGYIEQKQIVEILDEAFQQIDQAKANIEKNIQNAKELFQSKLNDIFSQKGAGWEVSKIDEFCELIDSLHKTPTYSDSGYAMVRVTEIKGGLLDTSKALRVNEDVYLEFSKRYKPKTGDIIMSRVGASFGVCSYVFHNEAFCLGQNTVYIIPRVDSRIVFYFLQSPIAREQMNNLSSGSAQPTISLKSIKAIEMMLPPIGIREKIIGEIELIKDYSESLQNKYEEKLNNYNLLKKSILQKAFAGKLTNKMAEV